MSEQNTEQPKSEIADSLVGVGKDLPPATCEVCGAAHGFQWTDHHGIGVCYRCSAPYTIFHYDADNKRIDKAPEMALTAEALTLARRYWQETQRKVFPAYYDITGFDSRGLSYSGATQDDQTAFNEWLDKQPEVIAALSSESSEAA